MKLKVVNTGNKVRDRLGIRFVPKQEQEIEVSNREYLTVKAVKDLTVTIVEKEGIIPDNNDNNDDKNDVKETLGSANVEDFISIVVDNDIDIDEAIALEVSGKNRPSLLEKLEALKQGE